MDGTNEEHKLLASPPKKPLNHLQVEPAPGILDSERSGGMADPNDILAQMNSAEGQWHRRSNRMSMSPIMKQILS